MSLFTEFDLLPSLQATLQEMELTTPTEIQERAVPELLEERSVVGVSQTGSGKTLAYVLPILHLLKSLENRGLRINLEGSPRACVIVPTRELGEQVTRVFKPFTHSTRLRVRSVLGGTTLDIAKRNISGPFEILVATPGRLIKLLERRLIQLSDVRILVFDEAISPSVQLLIDQLFKDVDVIRTEGSESLVPTLTTKNLMVPNGKRFPLLEKLLMDPVPGGTLLFVNTRDQCDKLAADLYKAKHECVIYRGEMDKVERRKNLKTFRDGQVALLVSTDLASRGLDVASVGRVINYHMPQQLENYIHRVGRTARAGRKGLVVNFVTERDQDMINSIKAYSKEPKNLKSR
jgi:ATP-dependent RNA helicase RhlE